MIYNTALNGLLSQWQCRLHQKYDASYKDALNDCIYELNQLINNNMIEEMADQEAYEYYTSQEADDFLASMENHECTV